MTYTQETLRSWEHSEVIPAAVLQAHADAWEADLKHWQIDAEALAEANKRLEAALPFVEAAAEEAFTGPEWAEKAKAWLAALAAGETISDGYQTWDKQCPECGKDTMQVVRPGHVQCSECG